MRRPPKAPLFPYPTLSRSFGTLADFDRLVREAHRRRIKVVIDFVLNHTSDQHPFFKEARSSKSSPKRDWYIWRDPRPDRSEEHTSELQSRQYLVCRLLLEK